MPSKQRVRAEADRYIPYLYSFLMVLVPWEVIHGKEFVDLERYTNYFLSGTSVLEYRSFETIADMFLGEILWHSVIPYLNNVVGINLEYIFTGISFICGVSFSAFLYKRVGVWALLFLINPLFISLAFSQLRMALAFSLLIIAYEYRKYFLHFVLALASIFIHTSMLLFISLFLFVRIVVYLGHRNLIDTLINKIVLLFVGVIFALLLGPLRDVLLGFFGDRRIGYGDISSSLLYTSIWIGLLLISLIQSKKFYEDEVNSYAVIMLTIASLSSVVGGYTTRLLAVSLPFILVAIFNFAKKSRTITIFVLVIYMVFQWVYWIQIDIV